MEFGPSCAASFRDELKELFPSDARAEYLSRNVLTFGEYLRARRAEIEWRDTWLGALFTAALFIVGKQAIGLYLGQTTVASSFGAAASVVAPIIALTSTSSKGWPPAATACCGKKALSTFARSCCVGAR